LSRPAGSTPRPRDEVLRLLPYWPQERSLELAPKPWKATRAKLRPDELATLIGSFTIQVE
jgi:transposase